MWSYRWLTSNHSVGDSAAAECGAFYFFKGMFPTCSSDPSRSPSDLDDLNGLGIFASRSSPTSRTSGAWACKTLNQMQATVNCRKPPILKEDGQGRNGSLSIFQGS